MTAEQKFIKDRADGKIPSDVEAWFDSNGNLIAVMPSQEFQDAMNRASKKKKGWF